MKNEYDVLQYSMEGTIQIVSTGMSTLDSAIELANELYNKSKVFKTMVIGYGIAIDDNAYHVRSEHHDRVLELTHQSIY